MRIPDRLLKSVGFVSRFEPEEDGARLHFGGTAFIVGVHTDERFVLAHIVTAKHVAKAIEPEEAVIAMNAKDGLPLYLRSGSQRWFYHPTEPDTVDVAVLPFGSPRFLEYDITWVLAEGRSIGGLSGSPVFVRNTVKTPMQTTGGSPAYMSGLGAFHLLGLMHGHWDLPVSFSQSEQAEAVNMGVSIVVPAKKILEALYHPELVAMRRRFIDELKDTERPKTDTAFDLPVKLDFEGL